MSYELTQHARGALQERQIPVEWMERVIAKPALVQSSPKDPTVESRLANSLETFHSATLWSRAAISAGFRQWSRRLLLQR